MNVLVTGIHVMRGGEIGPKVQKKSFMRNIV
jgi:hypothetical protein